MGVQCKLQRERGEGQRMGHLPQVKCTTHERSPHVVQPVPKETAWKKPARQSATWH
jgi:hypothetical protein